MTDALMKVATGFKLVYTGLMLVVLAYVLALLGACVLGGVLAAGAGGGGNNPQAAQGGAAMAAVLVLGFAALAIVGSIVGLVGRFFCMAVPGEETGAAKPMIVTSVVLELVSLTISVVNAADDLGEKFLPPQVKAVASGGGMIFSITAAILFLLFTRSVAEFVRRRKLAAGAMSVLWYWVASIGCIVVGIALMVIGMEFGGGLGPGRGGGPNNPAAGAAAGACVGLFFMFAALVVALVALIKYAKLLTEMSTAVRQFAQDRGYDRDLDDEYEYDDRPRRRRRRDDDDEDDENDYDDRPRRRRGDDDYDDDEDDDRPRRRNW